MGGIASALCLLLMILTIIPIATYTMPALAGMVLIVVVIENGYSTAWMVYAAVGFLSLFICPDKEAAMLFVGFFGYYPILKAVMESKLRPVLCWVLKIGSFLLTMVVSYFLMIKLMGVTIDEIDEFGVMAIPMLLGLGTFAFVLYDIALSKLVTLYMLKWRKYFKRYFK